jgi:hypothetical protein
VDVGVSASYCSSNISIFRSSWCADDVTSAALCGGAEQCNSQWDRVTTVCSISTFTSLINKRNNLKQR